jgi:hypothetical protein
MITRTDATIYRDDDIEIKISARVQLPDSRDPDYGTELWDEIVVLSPEGLVLTQEEEERAEAALIQAARWSVAGA